VVEQLPINSAIQYLHDKKHDHLTVRQLVIMLSMRDGPQTVRGLAAKLNLHRPAITRSMDKFVGRGWVTRYPDPQDKRSVFMGLTTKGRTLMNHFV